MTEIRWEQYPLVAQHELARNWLQRQAHLQLAPTTWMHMDAVSTIT